MKNSNTNLGTLMSGDKYAAYHNTKYYTATTAHTYLTDPGTQFLSTSHLKLPKESFTTQDLDASYNKIQVLRQELDAKLKELYGTEDSIFQEEKMVYDANVYAGLLWTVLATSIIYYVFTKV